MKTDSTKRKFLNVIAELNEDEKREVLEYVHALAAGDYEKCRAMEAAHGMNLTDRVEIGA
ncbi:MAG: hypothetical protein ACLVJB_01325 [Christensenellales bacterium]